MNKLKDIYKDLRTFAYIQVNNDNTITFNHKKYPLETSVQDLYTAVKQYNDSLTTSKIDRLNKINEVYWIAKEIIKMYERTSTIEDMYIPVVEDLAKRLKGRNILDNKHIRIDELDNKGKIEKYLFVCGVQHQFNLDLDVFIERIEEKINKEYTSQRTKDAIDGNDWKALSHALRILSQIKELYETGDIKFPLKNKEFILKVKLGQVSREEVNKIFDTDMSNVLNMVKEDKLQWRYDEEFWNNFLLGVIK